jgi:hypothetical protein
VSGALQCFNLKLKLFGPFADHSLFRRFVIAAVGAGQAAICGAVGGYGVALGARKLNNLPVRFLLRWGWFVNVNAVHGRFGRYKIGGRKGLLAHNLDLAQ